MNSGPARSTVHRAASKSNVSSEINALRRSRAWPLRAFVHSPRLRWIVGILGWTTRKERDGSGIHGIGDARSGEQPQPVRRPKPRRRTDSGGRAQSRPAAAPGPWPRTGPRIAAAPVGREPSGGEVHPPSRSGRTVRLRRRRAQKGRGIGSERCLLCENEREWLGTIEGGPGSRRSLRTGRRSRFRPRWPGRDGMEGQVVKPDGGLELGQRSPGHRPGRVRCFPARARTIAKIDRDEQEEHRGSLAAPATPTRRLASMGARTLAGCV